MERKLKALIVDDERLARMELIKLLGDHPGIVVAGEAEDVTSALEKIDKLKPDLIFLDIQMPGQSGFDLAVNIDPGVKIIFVTAYDEYAIRAFEINALDYLLKPVYPERLNNTIERILSGEENSDVKEISADLGMNDRIFICANNCVRFVKIAEIIAVNAAGDYTEILEKNSAKTLISKSMKEWESRLPEDQFIRIHRATIINLNYIEKIEEWFNHSYKVRLKGHPEPFVISRRYAAKLKAKFN